MFTGLIQEIGALEAIDASEAGGRLRIAASLATEIAEGDSIAVSGTCLTAARVAGEAFEADVMRQTLSLTTLGSLAPGDRVNLELALRASDRLGGHIVQGHVDGVGEVAAVKADGIARRLRVSVPDGLSPLIAGRGSIAVDGVSLTVSGLDEGTFEVALIPETLEETTLGALEPGDRVNVEVDVLARYVQRLNDSLSTSMLDSAGSSASGSGTDAEE